MSALQISDRPANIFFRLLALLYDFLLLGGLWTLFAFVAVAVNSWSHGLLSDQQLLLPQPVFGLWFQISLWLIGVLYFSLFWWRRGQTPGMSAWNIILCELNRKAPPMLSKAIQRAMLAPLSALCFGLGYLHCFVSNNSNYWHDSWSGTRILRVHAD